MESTAAGPPATSIVPASPNHVKHVRAQGRYEFRESIWEAAIFIGTGCLGSFGSAYVFVLLMINLCMQGLYCFILVNRIAVPQLEEEDLEGMWMWRTHIAHDYKYMDTVSHASLARRVCSGDKSLEMSTVFTDTINIVHDYTAIGDGLALGESMCIIALLSWCFSLLKEIWLIEDRWRALALVSWDRTLITAHDDGWKLEGLSRTRIFFLVCLTAARLSVAVVMLYCGTLFLIHTVNISELILHAVALEFVLNVDELIYVALCPYHLKTVITKMEPLTIGVRKNIKGIETRPCLSLLMASLWVSASVIMWGGTVADNLVRAHSILCHGQLDFVFVIDSTGWMTWHETAQLGEPLGSFPSTLAGYPADSFLDRTVQSLIRATDQTSMGDIGVRASKLTGSAFSLGERVNWPMSTNAEVTNPFCEDVLVGLGGGGENAHNIRFVRDVVGEENVHTCEHVVAHCDEDSLQGATARRFCPQVCGCDRPDSSLLLVGPPSGCSSACHELPAFAGVLLAAPCTERTAGELATSPDWLAYIAAVTVAIEHYPPGPLAAYTRLQELLLSDGCGAARSFDGHDLCKVWGREQGFSWKSLRIFCPITCECRSGDAECPATCPS